MTHKEKPRKKIEFFHATNLADILYQTHEQAYKKGFRHGEDRGYNTCHDEFEAWRNGIVARHKAS